MNQNKYFCILACALVFSLAYPTAVQAGSVSIAITEEGKITSFYDQYYVYRINGTATITNPTNYSLFNIEIPFYISTLSVRTNQTQSDRYMSDSHIYLNSLGPEETVVFDYRLLGITTEDLSLNEESVLYNGILALDPKIYSNLFGTLKKAPIEDPLITGRNARLISVELRNPTEFTYTIDKIDVIKTADMDLNDELNRWTFAHQKSVLEAQEGWDFDFLDENAVEGEIYWLTTDIYIDTIDINSSTNLTRYTQDDLFIIETNETMNITINETLDLLDDRVFVRKMISTTLVNPGDFVDVTLLVNNLEPRDIEFHIKDEFPAGFEFISSPGGTVEQRSVVWNEKLSSGLAKRFTYQVRFVDQDLLGIDYFRPAVLTYRGEDYYSQSIPFVRKYIPENKAFVQKNVRFLTGEEVQITITVKNLGESTLENLVLREHLLPSAEFREITMQPTQRGLWNIPSLRAAETWQTSYVTDRTSVFNTMPELFGVPKGSVLQTIILSSLIDAHYSVLSTRIVEFVALGLLAVIIILYFLPSSYLTRKKIKQTQELKVISRELDQLKHNTTPSVTHPSIQQPLRAPDAAQQRTVLREDPARIARHQSVEQAQALLEKSYESITGVPRKKPVEEESQSDQGKEKSSEEKK